MKKRVIHYINLVLGIVSLSLAGCHTQKPAAPESAPRPMLKYGVPPQHEVIALYGVMMPTDQPQDTTAVRLDE